MSALIHVKDDGTFRRIPVDDGPQHVKVLQGLVDGWLEVVYSHDFLVFINEEGRLHERFRPNPHIDQLLAAHGVSGHSIMGPAVIMVRGDEDALPLPDEMASELTNELRGLGCIEEDAIVALAHERAIHRDRQDNDSLDALPLEPWVLLLAKKVGSKVVDTWLTYDGLDLDDPDYAFHLAVERVALRGYLLQTAAMAVGAVESIERKAGAFVVGIEPEAHSAQIIRLVCEIVETELSDLNADLPQRICRLIRAVGMFTCGSTEAGIAVAAEATSTVLAMDAGAI